MVEHYKHYSLFYLILATWLIVGTVSSSIAIVLVFSSVLLFWKSKRYFELFMGFVFLLVLSDNLDHFQFAKTFKNVYILILAFVLIVERDKFKPFSAIHKGFLPFIIIAFYALIFSGSPSVNAQKNISYLLLLIVVPNYCLYLFRENKEVLLKDIMLFLLSISLLGLAYRFIDIEFSYLAGRFRGVFGNPNGMGIFIYLTFAFYFCVDKIFPLLFSKIEKRFIILTILYILFICGSRSSIVSVLLLLIFSRLYKSSPFFGFVILVGITMSLEYFFSNLGNIVMALGLEDYFRIRTLEQGSGRFIAWEFAWEKIQDFYYFGGGLGNDEYIMRQNYASLAKDGHQGGVHNSFLTLWFDVGIVGLILYFGNMIRLFLIAAKKTKLAFPLFYSIIFSITYESWIAGSLNPFTIILFIIITLIVEPEIIPSEEPQPELLSNER